MATAKVLYPNFSDNGIRVQQFADGSMEITVIPQDPNRLAQFVFTVPAVGRESSATVLSADLPTAVANAVDFVNNGALPAGNPAANPPTDWPSKIGRATARAARAAKQAQRDAAAAQLATIDAELAAIPVVPAG